MQQNIFVIPAVGKRQKDHKFWASLGHMTRLNPLLPKVKFSISLDQQLLLRRTLRGKGWSQNILKYFKKQLSNVFLSPKTGLLCILDWPGTLHLAGEVGCGITDVMLNMLLCFQRLKIKKMQRRKTNNVGNGSLEDMVRNTRSFLFWVKSAALHLLVVYH